ncbi:MAG TPA: hypothetical protein VLY87_05560 [Flavobacterium sp.]|nr:hypothetical protein [Flavobacterium sp.]
MKLTQEQIRLIEEALIEKCDFKNFNDVRNELVDHIATEIEDEISLNLSFKDAFVKVMTRWNPLILSKSWSRYENVPYIVCKLWKSLDLKFKFSAIPVALLISYVFFLLQEKGYSIYLLLLPIIVLGIISNIYLLYKKFNNKVNSTLSMYALHNFFGLTISMVSFIIINILFFSSGIEKSIIPIFWPTIYCCLLIVGKAWVMQKHIKIENQLLKVI